MPTTDPADLKRVLMSLTQIGRLPEGGDASAGQALGQSPSCPRTDAELCSHETITELAARWRAEFMPHRMNPRYKRQWDLFLVLEVGFFYPFRKNQSSLPATRAQIGVLLADREHVAMVIADGDERQAASYLTPSHEEFWRSIVPDDEAVPEKTISGRVNRAVRLLASAPDGQVMSMGSSVAVSLPRPLPCPTQGQLPLHQESALSKYLRCALPEEPGFIPYLWRSVIPGDPPGPLTIIQGRTGTGKTQLMRWLAQEFRRRGATPLYLDLPSYASHAGEEDVFVHVSTQGTFANRYRDPDLAADLQRELAEEERREALVILADCPDELFDSEIPTVASRLDSFGHVVLAERSDILQIEPRPQSDPRRACHPGRSN